MVKKGLNIGWIIETAAELIEEKGYERFSLHDLADILNVKTASLYNHMSNISELTFGIGEYALKCLNKTLHENMETDDANMTLLSIAEGYRKFAHENQKLYKTIIKIPSTKDEELMKEGKACLYGLYEALDKFALNDEEKIHFSRSFRSAMHGFVALVKTGFF